MTVAVTRASAMLVVQQGRRAVDSLSKRPPLVPDLDRTYPIKLFADWQNIRAGDERFMWYIQAVDDLDGWTLTSVGIYVTEVSSSGIVQVQVRKNAADDMLSTRVQIDAGEFKSDDSGTPYVIDAAEAEVATGDRIAYDIDAAGTNAKGLGAHITFSPPA